MTSEPVILVEGLRKAYGDVVAVDGLSFSVGRGEIFGMVGPNGAGKTTTIECLEGLRTPDAGTIRVLGLDPGGDGRALRRRIGAQLQQSSLPARMKVREAVTLYAALYGNDTEPGDLLRRLDLLEKTGAPFAKLSGGQKQRLAIALALVHGPEIVFFDELTTGLDPQARRSVWDFIREIREGGRTVVLTTHFMEEAERLCDRVAIVDRGRIVACDSPAALVRGLGAGQRVVFVPAAPLDPAEIRAVPGVERVEETGGRYVVYGKGEALAVDVVSVLCARRTGFRELRTEQSNLEDVFLALTGREMRD